MTDIQKVSIHGGHSGQFCSHAADSLEEIVLEYIRQGFLWVGLTEHMPPKEERYLPPEEAAAGLDARGTQRRFEQYFEVARNLQEKYKGQIEIFVGFETEFFIGYESFINEIVARYRPDYITGSLHHVHDLFIDGPKEYHDQAIEISGSLEKLYIDYFDRQFDLINLVNPKAISHFDLIRFWDPDYASRIQVPEIWGRIERNLECIASKNLILDLNLRAYKKGHSEPFPSKAILKRAHELGVSIVPGDDSHGVYQVGNYFDQGIMILKELGIDLIWPKPA